MYNPLSVFFPKRTATANHDPLSNFWYGPTGQASTSGIAVTTVNATCVSAVYGCLRILRETLAYLPFFVYEKTGDDSCEKAKDYYLYDVLHKRPNCWQTPFQFVEMGVNHVCLHGNFYCLIMGHGDRTELRPLSPTRMEIKQLQNGKMEYHYREDDGRVAVHSQDKIYHVAGQTLDGITGVSVIEYARNTIGSTIAQETHGASLFKNGGLPAFWISRPPERKWTKDAQQNFRRGWRRLHGGAENTGNPPILQDGMELHSLGLSNRDSQWIESRGLSAEEICRFFGVSPHLIGVKTAAPLGSIEQQSLEFRQYTLAPLAARFEQAANKSLIVDPDKYYAKFNLDASSRSDTKTRHEAHNMALQGGWKTVNEVRALEDLNPVEGGDELQSPLNMQPLGGGPDENEQGGQPGKGKPKPPKIPEQAEPIEQQDAADSRAAFAILLDEAAERIAAAEVKAISARADKAAEDYDKWCDWLTTVGDKHRNYTFKTLLPICQSWKVSRVTVDCASLSANVCSCDWELLTQRDTDIPALLSTWKTTRATALATILKKEFFNEDL